MWRLPQLRREQKIDAVAAMMDAYIAYKHNREAFDHRDRLGGGGLLLVSGLLLDSIGGNVLSAICHGKLHCKRRHQWKPEAAEDAA